MYDQMLFNVTLHGDRQELTRFVKNEFMVNYRYNFTDPVCPGAYEYLLEQEYNLLRSGSEPAIVGIIRMQIFNSLIEDGHANLYISDWSSFKLGNIIFDTFWGFKLTKASIFEVRLRSGIISKIYPNIDFRINNSEFEVSDFDFLKFQRSIDRSICFYELPCYDWEYLLRN